LEDARIFAHRQTLALLWNGSILLHENLGKKLWGWGRATRLPVLAAKDYVIIQGGI